MPDVRFSFEPADIVSEVMSFGSPTPVEFTVNGPSVAENRAYAEKARTELAKVASLRDLQFVQALDYPTVGVQIDREKAGLSGVSVSEIARSLVAATSSSRFVVPNFWPDPKTGIGYQVQIEIPYQVMNSINEVETIPVQRSGADPLLLRDVATVTPGIMPGEFDRYDMKRVVSLTANTSGEDLGRVARRVQAAIARAGEPPKGSTVDVRGQIAPMNEILRGLAIGLGMAIVVIMLLLTANFQSVRLAIVVMSTAPAVLAGVVLALWLTRTTLNLQSFMGAIMSIGVAVANAILLVTFAERHRREQRADATLAAVRGAVGRLRPILMTTGAMIAGMLPMALGLGEGSEETAPLGRAVIGGLAAATLATLFVLPTVFAIVLGGAGRASSSIDPADPDSSRYDPQVWVTAAKFREPIAVAVLVVFATTAGGCNQASALKADHAPAAAVTRVEVVKPKRATIRRSTEQPGQIEPYEVTPIYAKVSGYVEKWTVDTGAKVAKGQILAALSVPELDAEAAQKQAMVEESQAKLFQAQASEHVARANLAERRRQAHGGSGRNQAGRRRPRPLAGRVQARRTALQRARPDRQSGRRDPQQDEGVGVDA